MAAVDSQMAQEIADTPSAVGRQAGEIAAPLAALAARLRARTPEVVVTCARGSSAHAATFGKHLIEHAFGIPVAAAAPSIATLYRRPLRLRDQLLLTVSQSGKSDDLVEQARSARAAGALTAGIVNAADSPLARACEIVLPMAAGPERSVAATKTFVASLAALARLVALWGQDPALSAALERLPQRLGQAHALDWSAPLDLLARASSLITIGRGPTLAIAREAALKLKETCNLHAEAFSGAEFLHGPVTLVAPEFPILLFMPGDEAAAGLRTLAADLRRKGATVFIAEPGERSEPGEAADIFRLRTLTAEHPVTDAMCQLLSFYRMTVALAARRGLDVDRPRHLAKVTRTR
jgi:glucosamine--fructose-6-phosphate aminotransferase (isomerizing)